MKFLRFLQVGLLALLIFFLFQEKEYPLQAAGKEFFAKSKRSYYGRRGRHTYYRYPRYYFRFYFSPNYRSYGYYYTFVSLNISDDRYIGDRILNVYFDGIRVYLPPASFSGNRGHFSYKVYSGYHTIEWTIEKPNGNVVRLSKTFYTDRYSQNVNIYIEGSNFYIQ
ncbi:MAG: hypothetical protein COT84_04130 [Chlamydiae bacterium CG10_big_fil_rev_8_21_14_0_10_35_9]|nr:MAG: hypothetical protein COT84_04130 [Chlamydiae bacterium CG10_big_fil_rev_8_21_14_0_10_35_9]